MGRGPVECTRQVSGCPWLMQPALVIRDDRRGANKPNPVLLLFNKDLAPSKLLAQRNLAVGSDDFDASGVGNGLHNGAFVLH